MENVSDRELFSELVDNPINPLHVHIVPPFVKENNPMFYLQINGEAAFKWRDSYGQPCKVFNLLQRSILPLGYQLMASAEERVGKAFSESIRRFWRKIQAIKNGNKRKQLKAETWLTLAIKPEEFKQTPNDALADTVNVEEEAHDRLPRAAIIKFALFPALRFKFTFCETKPPFDETKP